MTIVTKLCPSHLRKTVSVSSTIDFRQICLARWGADVELVINSDPCLQGYKIDNKWEFLHSGFLLTVPRNWNTGNFHKTEFSLASEAHPVTLVQKSDHHLFYVVTNGKTGKTTLYSVDLRNPDKKPVSLFSPEDPITGLTSHGPHLFCRSGGTIFHLRLSPNLPQDNYPVPVLDNIGYTSPRMKVTGNILFLFTDDTVRCYPWTEEKGKLAINQEKLDIIFNLAGREQTITAIDTDGKKIAVGKSDGSVTIYETKKTPVQFQAHTNIPVSHIRFLGERLVTAAGCHLKLWPMKADMHYSDGKQLYGHAETIHQLEVVIPPSGEISDAVLVTMGHDLKIWSLKNDTFTKVEIPRPLFEKQAPVLISTPFEIIIASATNRWTRCTFTKSDGSTSGSSLVETLTHQLQTSGWLTSAKNITTGVMSYFNTEK